MPSAQNLPTLEKTWNINPQALFVPDTTDPEIAAKRAWLFVTAQLMDKLRRIYGGTFAAGSMGGDTRLTITSGATASPWLGSPGFTATNGKQLVIDAGTANSAGNEGTFTIVAAGSNWVEYNNGSAVFEADSTVSAHVLAGILTTPPCKVKGSGAGSTGLGAAMDGRDRWITEADLQSSTSAVGNKSWLVLEFVNGSEILFVHDTNSSTFDWVRIRCWLCPDNTNGGFTGGTATVIPTIPADAFEHIGDTSSFWGDTSLQSDTNFITIMSSTDGLEWRMIMGGNNTVQTIWWGGEIVDHYDDGSALIPSPVHGVSGVRPWLDVSRTLDALALTFAAFSDGAAVYHTVDRDAAAGGPWVDGAYMTSEMVTTEMLGQHYDNSADQLTAESQEWAMMPMGLFSNTATRRGHIGRIRDVWWGNQQEAIPPIGSNLPNDNTRLFIKLGHLVFPWDGATNWRKN